MSPDTKLPWGVELVRRESLDFIGWETVGRVRLMATQLTTDIENATSVPDIDWEDKLKVMRKLRDGLARSLSEVETFLKWAEGGRPVTISNETQEEKGRT